MTVVLSLNTKYLICKAYVTAINMRDDEWMKAYRFINSAFLKLWSADHKWSSGSALVVLLD